MRQEFQKYRVEASFTKDKRVLSVWLQHPNVGNQYTVFKDKHDHEIWRWIQIKPENW